MTAKDSLLHDKARISCLKCFCAPISTKRLVQWCASTARVWPGIAKQGQIATLLKDSHSVRQRSMM